MNETSRLYQRFATLTLAVIFIVAAFLIIRPFAVAILSAGVLAYFFNPLNNAIKKKIPHPLPKDVTAALLTETIIILLIVVPTIFVGTLLSEEAQNGYHYMQKYMAHHSFVIQLPDSSVKLNETVHLKDIAGNLSGQLFQWTQNILGRIQRAFLIVLIMIFCLYYFIKEQAALIATFKSFFPLPEKRYHQIATRLESIVRGLVIGQLIISVIHGLLAWAVFAFLGVYSPVFWAFITAIASVIPVLGVGIVLFPFAIFLLIFSPAGASKGLFLLAYAIFAATVIDNMVKPKIIGSNANIHPLIVLFGILGGIQLIGIPGIIIGPVVLALFDVFMELFRDSL